MNDALETLASLAANLLRICGAWILVRGAVWLTDWLVHGFHLLVP
jgi:hypothetical protein